METHKRLLGALFSLALIGALFYFLFRRLSWNDLQAGVAQMWEGGALLALIFWSLSYVLLQGLRFATIFPAGLSLKRHLGLAFAGHAGNILLPARLGEAVRPFYLKLWNPQLPLKSVVGWTLWEKLAEFLGLLVVILISLFLHRQGLLGTRSSWMLMIACFLTVLLATLLACLRWHRRGGQHTHSRWQALGWAMLLSLAAWLANFLGLLAVTSNPTLSMALLITLSVAGAFPLLPGGLGAAQWAFVLLNDWMHLATSSEAVIYATTVHLIWILLRLSVGVLLLTRWGWPRKLESVKNAVQASL